jgi:hypothetical protein
MQFGNTDLFVEACHPRFLPLRVKNARSEGRPIPANARRVEGEPLTLFIKEIKILYPKKTI